MSLFEDPEIYRAVLDEDRRSEFWERRHNKLSNYGCLDEATGVLTRSISRHICAKASQPSRSTVSRSAFWAWRFAQSTAL